MNDDLKEQYLNGELSGAERRKFEKTMAADRALVAEMERQSQVDRMLRVVMDSGEAERAIVQSVMNRISEPEAEVTPRTDSAFGHLLRLPWLGLRISPVKLGLAAAIVLVFGLLFFKGRSTPKELDIAVVENTVGHGFVTRSDSGRIEMAQGMALKSGDSIEIQDGLIQYFFVGGEGFELKDQFRGKVDSKPDQDAITLSWGTVRVWPRGGPKRLVVINENARVTAKDSKFMVSTVPEGVRIETWDGEVQVEAAGTGQQMTLEGGQYVVVDETGMLKAFPLP